MNAVSNTSPLNYLLLVGEVEILRKLFSEIYAPAAVVAELSSPGSPNVVRQWAHSAPPWLRIREPSQVQPGLALHIGETHAISLALELKIERLIIDDYAGREAAQSLSIPVLGTLGVLDLAAQFGLIDLPQVATRLAGTNFRMPRAVLDEMLQRDATRRNKNP